MDLAFYVAAGVGIFVLALLRLLFKRTVREHGQRLSAEESLRHATHLSQLTAALSRAKLPADAMRAAVIELVHAFKAAAGALVVAPEEARHAFVSASIGYAPAACADAEPRLPLAAKAQVAEAIRRHELQITASRAARLADFPDSDADDFLCAHEAAAVVPLIAGGRAFGAIVLSFDAARTFSGEEHTVLLVAGRHIAQAIVRAQLYESAERARAESEDFRVRADAELRERHKAEEALRESEGKYRALAARTARLYELSAALSEAITLDSVAKVIVRHGKAVIGASAASVAMLVDAGRQFETLYAEGYTRLTVEAWHRFAAETGLCATAAADTRAPVFVASLAEWQSQYPRSGALAADSGFESAVALPLLSEGAVIGVLSFHFTVPVNFTPEYTALLRSVSQHCAQALDRARLYEAAQRARADAESANRAKDDFLSTLSHELRTPLNAMLGWASMLRNGTLDADRKARALEAIFSNASRQAQLIEDLLDVSRIVAGRSSLDIQEFNLADTLRGAVDALMPVADAKRVTLQLAAIPAIAVIADPRRLEQVFLNLISNAVKFTPADGRVTIDATLYDGSVDVRVADTGAGIDPAFLPHVFERFRQGDTTLARRVGGLGLGLFIARHLVDAQGGSIRAESDGIGRGTTLTVTMPVADGSAAHAARPVGAGASRAAVPPRLTGVRVLLVDDEADTREVMMSALETCGANVTAAASAREAIETLATGRFDVLLSDIAMPGGDGLALIRDVRRLPSPAAACIPAAAVTALASDEDRQRTIDAGFQTHLTKPVAPAVLAEAVASLVHLGSPI